MVRTKSAEERRSEAILISVTRDTRAEVERVCRKEGLTFAELGRRALDRYLRELEPAGGMMGDEG